MRSILTLSMVIFITFSLFSQSPQKLSYQAVIRDAGDVLVTNRVIRMRISILQSSVSGTVVYSETQTPTTNANGLVSIEIGGGAGFDAINWTSGPYFLKTETDPAGGTNYTINGTSQLLSVPYALHAKNSETSDDAVKITGNQTIAGNKTFSGTTTVIPPVNPSDAATKAYVDVLSGRIEYLESIVGVEEPVTDYDGNIYPTIRIGTQVWMTKNLITTKLKYGGTIPLVTDNTAWSNLTTPGYCWYNNDEAANKDTYGALYNWYTIGTTNLCPMGWHVPTDAEWTILTTYLGGLGIAGGKLKETGTAHWISPNTGATNETGFKALPGGARYNIGQFADIGDHSYWWSATEYDAANSWYHSLYYDNSIVDRYYCLKKTGLSVRCLKD